MSDSAAFDIITNFNNVDSTDPSGYQHLVVDESDETGLNQQQQTDELLNEFLDTNIYEESIKMDESNYQTPEQSDIIHSLLSQNFIETASRQPQEDDYIFKVNSSNDSNNSIVPPQTPPNDSNAIPYQMVDQNMDIDYAMNDYYDISKLSDTQSVEFQMYEESRKELMKLKFGGPLNQHNSNNNNLISNDKGIFNTTVPSQIKLEDYSTDSDHFQLPESYLDTSNDDNLPYKLQVTGLPDSSRVETQIKISLSVSPPPPQFLLQLPSDTISKTKLRLQQEVPESSKKHILCLDTYVLTSGELSSSKKKFDDSLSPNSEVPEQALKLNSSMKNCNICSRCVRRELKRASRRKNGTLEDGFNWNISGPKRAVIFNCKEIISFPPPSILTPESSSNEKNIEISSRIVCYCRHHSESKGFRLFFVLKNYDGEILGKTFSKPIMIMDRKKSKSLVNLGDELKKEHPLSPTSLDESSSELQTAVSDDSRPSKRKRGWSPSLGSISTSTYYDSVQQQRSISTTVMPKKEPFSPTDSETQKSPTNFHNNNHTSDRNESITSITSNSSSYMPKNVRSSVHTPSVAPPPNQPTIQRIIPGQGPIRGGIEVTLLGSNFRPGLIVKFGANQALTTHCWSDSTIVTYLPPVSTPGQVLVTFENVPNGNASKQVSPQQVFTYTDDTDRQLIELALQIVGLKMNGKLEDAKNIAKRIIGNSNDGSSSNQSSPTGDVSGTRTNNNQLDIDQDWYSKATETVKQLSQSSSNTEEVLLKFLSLLDLSNSPVTSPNWAVCTNEGQTLLHLAAIKDYYKLVLYLINKGSRIDYKDVNDFTPLHLAFMNGNREIIEVLVRCGANVNNKIRSHVTLEKISNSNVLDMISVSEFVESSIYDLKTHSRRPSNDSISSILSGLDNGLGRHISRMVDEPSYQNEDSSADDFADESDALYDEDDEDESEDTRESEEVREEQEDLPNYDDLYPSTKSLKALIKSVSSGKIRTVQEEESSSSMMEEVEMKDEPSDDRILKFFIHNSSRTTPVMRDRMLFFFWLPLLLVAMLLMLGFNDQMIFTDQLEKFNGFLRLQLLNFMLGRDRVEGMINSVNAAVTAGLNNMTR